MSAGAGTKAYRDARALERLLIASFGPDFRRKEVRTVFGSFRLADAFEECGLVDPQAPAPSSGAYGLWQVPPPIPLPLAPLSPADQLREAARYIAERRISSWRAEAEAVAVRWRRYVADSSRWPLSPAPRSPHGDPLLNT